MDKEAFKPQQEVVYAQSLLSNVVDTYLEIKATYETVPKRFYANVL